MKRKPLYLFLALLTFAVGLSLTSVWLYRKTSANAVSVMNEPQSCAVPLAEKITAPDDRANTLADLAGFYSKNGDVETARKLLEDALKSAELIEDPFDKAVAIRHISDAGETGHLEKTLSIARTVKEDDLQSRLWAYRESAKNFIRLNRRDRAKFVLDEAVSHLRSLKYEDSERMELDLSFLGQLYAQAGFCKEAMQLFEGFKNAARIGEIKRESAVCFAVAGQTETAFSTAKGIAVYEQKRADALLEMAKIYAGNGDQKLTERALNEALKVTRGKDWSTYHNDQALEFLKIVDFYRTLGRDDEALKILEEAEAVAGGITNPNFEIPAKAEISEKYAEMRLFDKALKIMPSLKNTQALSQVARNMFEAGDRENALKLLNDTYNSPYKKSDSMVNIADVYADNGFDVQAAEVLEKMKNDYSHAENYAFNSGYEKLLSVFFKLKRYDSALEFASKLGSSPERIVSIAATEAELKKNKNENNEEIQKIFKQIGCEAKK